MPVMLAARTLGWLCRAQRLNHSGQHQYVGTVGRQWMQSAGRESAAVSTNKNTLLTWETTVLIWWPGAESTRAKDS